MRLVRHRIAILLTVTIAALAGCSSPFAPSEESQRSVAIASELHKIELPGFTFSEISEPDSQLAQSFQTGARTDSAFSAAPDAAMSTAEQCETIIGWAQKNLTDILTFAQYNETTAGITYATQACRLLPRNWIPGFSLAGLYDQTVVQIGPEGNTYRINIDGTGASLVDLTSNADASTAATTLLLEAINEARNKESRFLTESEMTQVWNSFQKPVSQMEASWKQAEDGTVHHVYMSFSKTGLLPFCVDVGPWNSELAGQDPGGDYLLLLMEDLEAGRNFGSAVSGECP